MNTDQVLKFVELYSNCVCLWDVNSPLYKDRLARDNALKHISDEMEILGFGPKEVAQKIKNIRTSYKQEIRKMAASETTGEVYKPKVPWFNCIDSFLRGFHKSNVQVKDTWTEKSISPINVIDVTEHKICTEKVIKSEYISPSDIEEESPVEVNSCKRLKFDTRGEPLSFSCVSDAMDAHNIERIPSYKVGFETEFDLWARSLAVQLNNMDISRALKLQLQIQTIVTNERLEHEASIHSSDSPSASHGFRQSYCMDVKPVRRRSEIKELQHTSEPVDPLLCSSVNR